MAQPAHNTTASVAHEAPHGDGEFPPFNAATYPAQLIWLAITFGFLYYMMAKVIVPRLGGLIEARQRTIASDLDEATAMRARAEEAGAAYEMALNGARSRAQTIAADTKAALASETDAKRKALEADLASKLVGSEAQINARTRDAMANVQAIAVETASAIVERLTGRVPAPSTMAKAAQQEPQL